MGIFSSKLWPKYETGAEDNTNSAIIFNFLSKFQTGFDIKSVQAYLIDLGWVWIARLVFGVCVFPSFFFFARVCESAATVHVLFNEQ